MQELHQLISNTLETSSFGSSFLDFGYLLTASVFRNRFQHDLRKMRSGLPEDQYAYTIHPSFRTALETVERYQR